MNKNITVNLKNIDSKQEAITTALEEIQKRCTARTIDFSDVKAALKKVCDLCPVEAKTARAGICFSIDPNGQTFPNAYKAKGRHQSTIISGEFTKSGLKICFTRDDTHSTMAPCFSGFNKDQAFRILEQAGCDTYMLNKAVNLYENTTKNSVF